MPKYQELFVDGQKIKYYFILNDYSYKICCFSWDFTHKKENLCTKIEVSIMQQIIWAIVNQYLVDTILLILQL